MHLRSPFCILLILSCTITVPPAASSNAIGEADHDLFRYIHEDLENRFLDEITPCVQRMGHEFVYLAICLSLCAFGDEKKAETGKLATVAALEAGPAARAIKRIVGRPRPLNKEATDSFPSGHTTLAFAMATVAGNRHPRLRIALYALALGTAFSRVYLGHHYPSDVIVGAAIGTLAGVHVIYHREMILRLSF